MKFEDYLQAVCFERNPGVLDDNMPDFYEAWLSERTSDDWIDLAEEYKKLPEKKLEEYKIEALKEEFDGERIAVHAKYVYSQPDSIGLVAREFVKSQDAERFNVWMKVKV